MRRIGIAVRVLLVLALVGLGLGLVVGVQAQGDDGLVAEWHFDEGVCVSGFMISTTKRLIPE